MHDTVDQLVAESTIQSIGDALKNNSVVPEVQKFQEEFEELAEELSTGDWGRIGVIAGMLWYKLDMVIKHLADISSSSRNIDRNTSKIK